VIARRLGEMFPKENPAGTTPRGNDDIEVDVSQMLAQIERPVGKGE
jgi:hypothetical protein